MSMLSAQMDELRELATRYDELQVGAVKAVTMPPNMGSILREAADTIWELRDDLQRANAENASLRERVDAAHMSRLLTENENESLRELLSVMAYCNQFRRDCDGCIMNGAAGIITERAGCDELLARLRDLGVEVDG